MSLYDDLGVNKDADPKEIKKAYYGKAKEAHPDAGGDPEKWERVSKAYLVLSNPKKRSKYDKNGETEGEEADTELSRRLQIIAGAIRELIDADPPMHLDWLDLMKEGFNRQIRNFMDSIKESENEINRFEKLKKRLKRKKDANPKSGDFLTMMLNKRIHDEKDTIEDTKQRIKDFETCIVLIDDYDFETDAMPESQEAVVDEMTSMMIKEMRKQLFNFRS